MIDNIGKMTLKQLKREYALCDENTPKKTLLAKLIKRRELMLTAFKSQNTPQSSVKTPVKNRLEELLDIDITMSDDEKTCDDSQNPDMVCPEKTQCKISVSDPKFKSEIEKDYANNFLMNRLNSELAFRTTGYNKHFVKPYLDGQNTPHTNTMACTYINDLDVMGIPDFSSTNIFGLHK